jgi:hypothetical protein
VLLTLLLALAACSICAMAVVVAATMRSSQLSRRVDGQNVGCPPQKVAQPRPELLDQSTVFALLADVGEEPP